MELSDKYKNIQLIKKKAPNSELAACVEEISKLIPLTKQYDFGYWCVVVKKAKVSYVEMIGVLKEVEQAHSKYNKGALLTSILKKRWIQKNSNK